MRLVPGYQLELRGALGDLGGEHTMEDMELLQRVMEVREQVEAATHEGELAGLREQNQHEEEECIQVDMHLCFAHADGNRSTRCAGTGMARH